MNFFGRTGGWAMCASLLLWLLAGCQHHRQRAQAPGSPIERLGDEIVACGQLFHTGAPVILWLDPGGYDAYRHEKRFGPATRATVPRTYGTRMHPLTDAEVLRVRDEGWSLDFLRQKVDQFVFHYDVCGTSQRCFQVLHDERGLSVQFMLDIDGTIYQTMDLKEEAWHASGSNGRSVGVEIANMGAYSGSILPLAEWYAKDADGRTRLTIPRRFGDGGVRTPDFVGRPARDEMVSGVVQGQTFRQYDFTRQQYDSLIKLTAALCTVFPKIQCDYPRDPASGTLIPRTLPWKQFDEYQGVLGHYHVDKSKLDPGPAFQWDLVINSAKELMTDAARRANARERGKPARFIPSEPPPKPPTTPGLSHVA